MHANLGQGVEEELGLLAPALDLCDERRGFWAELPGLCGGMLGGQRNPHGGGGGRLHPCDLVQQLGPAPPSASEGPRLARAASRCRTLPSSSRNFAITFSWKDSSLPITSPTCSLSRTSLKGLEAPAWNTAALWPGVALATGGRVVRQQQKKEKQNGRGRSVLRQVWALTVV